MFFFLYQGRKGDPGISPGPAPKGEKVPNPSFVDTLLSDVLTLLIGPSVFQGDSGIIGPVGLAGQEGRKVTQSDAAPAGL